MVDPLSLRGSRTRCKQLLSTFRLWGIFLYVRSMFVCNSWKTMEKSTQSCMSRIPSDGTVYVCFLELHGFPTCRRRGCFLLVSLLPRIPRSFRRRNERSCCFGISRYSLRCLWKWRRWKSRRFIPLVVGPRDPFVAIRTLFGWYQHCMVNHFRCSRGTHGCCLVALTP